MHNEELCIEEFYRRTDAAMRKAGYIYEIVLVNDGSTDDTERLLRQICEKDPKVKGISLSRNRGQCTALYAGLQNSRGRWVVIMDGDLQNLPEEIHLLVEKIQEGWDVVSGQRVNRSESRWLRLLPSRIANWMIRKASGCEIYDMGGFSCVNGDMARGLHLREGHHRFIPALIYRIGGAVTEIPTTCPPRFAGKSHYGLSRIVDVLFDIVTIWFQNAFKQRPVYLFGRIALAFFVFASLIMAWVLIEKIFMGVDMGTRPPFFGAILFYLASLGFMSTGFILEAIGDTMDTVMRTRPYKIREILNGENPSEEGDREPPLSRGSDR